MFRSVFNSLVPKRLLNPSALQHANCVRKDVSASYCLKIYDARINSQFNTSFARSLCPSNSLLDRTVWNGTMCTSQVMRSASASTMGGGIAIPNIQEIGCNYLNMLKCIDMEQLKVAPPPAFWVGMVGGATFFSIPLLEMLFGYSHFLTMVELNSAAAFLAVLGGMKWGLSISDSPIPPPTWENIGWSLVPPAVAVLGLLLPTALGFITIGAGVVSALYIDLKSCAYAPWACALGVFMTIVIVISLTLALIGHLLFSRATPKEGTKEKQIKKKEDAKAKANGRSDAGETGKVIISEIPDDNDDDDE